MEDDLKDAFYLWEKEQRLAVFFVFLVPPRIKEHGSQENQFPSLKTPRSFLQERETPPAVSTDSTSCSVKELSLPKKHKTQTCLQLESTSCFQMLSPHS